LDATEENTEATIDSFSSSATVLKPKCVCLDSDPRPSAPKFAAGLEELNVLDEASFCCGCEDGGKLPVGGRSERL
jgi:hypothetical protein